MVGCNVVVVGCDVVVVGCRVEVVVAAAVGVTGVVVVVVVVTTLITICCLSTMMVLLLVRSSSSSPCWKADTTRLLSFFTRCTRHEHPVLSAHRNVKTYCDGL